MTFKDTLYTALLNDPIIYPNALDAYIGMFAYSVSPYLHGVYEWQGGELVNTQPLPNKTYTDMEDAVRHRVKEYEERREDIVTRGPWDMRLKEYLADSLEKEMDEVVGRIRDISGRMEDLSVRTESKSYVPVCQKTFFHPLSKTRSAICNMPDGIKPDWLDAAETFYGILLDNYSADMDPENTLPYVGKRIRELRRAGEKRAQG